MVVGVGLSGAGREFVCPCSGGADKELSFSASGVRRFGGEWLKGTKRVIRGGSWRNPAENCRSAIRNRNSPSNRNNNLGFRVARSSIRGGCRGGTSRSPVGFGPEIKPGRPVLVESVDVEPSGRLFLTTDYTESTDERRDSWLSRPCFTGRSC